MLSSARVDSSLVRVRFEEGIGWIEMVDEANRNAFGRAFVAALIAALRQVDGNPEARVAVLIGGSEIFCSGASAEVLDELQSGTIAPTELVLSTLLLNLSIPLIAACEGGAIGGGFALALAADIVVLASDRRYGFNFMDLGITPGMGTTRLAEHVLSPAIAHELLYSGELRRGSKLASAGVNAVLPSADVREHAELLAQRIAMKDRRNLGMLKRTLTLPRRLAFESARTLESLMHERSLEGLDLSAFGGRSEK